MATSEVLNTGNKKASAEPPQNAGSPRKRHGWTWFFVILAIAAAGFGYYWKTRPAPVTTDTQEAGRGRGRGAGAGGAVSVGVVAVSKQDVPFYLTGLGSVTAFYTVTVHSRVDGQMMKVYFDEGQFVHAGDALADIDPRPYQVALAQAQGQLAKDMASQADAKVDLARYQTLYQDGVIAKQQLDSQQATVGQFEGSIQGDQAQIDNEKLQLVYCHITSPIDGRVGLRIVDPGNIVHAADANGILVITQVTPIAVIFTLPEDNLPEVVSEMRTGKLQVEAYSRDDNTKLATGTLQTIDNQIDQTTGTVRLKAEFANTDLSLWPNQFVNIRLFLSMRKNAIVVPTATIQNGSQGTFVYTVNSDSTAAARPIQVDFAEGNISVIRQGLEAGEQVVFDGQDKLQPGTKVTPHPTNLNTGNDSGGSNSANAGGSAGGGREGNRGSGRGRGQDGFQGSGSSQGADTGNGAGSGQEGNRGPGHGRGRNPGSAPGSQP
jgi:membrane fusion protein, multidrug efflux system